MLPRVRPFLRVLMIACVAALSAVCAPLTAVAAPGGYTGETPVNSQSEEERAQARKTALANVVIAQSGDSGALARPDVARAVGQAERYVLQYQYRRNGGGDNGGARMTLVAQFDGAAVDQLLRKLGLGSGDDAAQAADAPSDATIWVEGVRNADDYARVIGYFGKNNFVRSAQPTAARGDGLLLKLSLSTDLGHFLEAVGMERTLNVVRPASPTAGVDATLALAP